MKSWLWVVVVMLGACGGGGGDPDEAASGSRLKLQWHDFGGGARTPTGVLVDKQLDDALCFLTTWDDSRTYCTPQAQAVVFLDDQCSKPAIRELDHACQAAPRYAAIYREEACGVQVARLFEVGALMTGVQIFEGGPGNCFQRDVADVRVAGPEVPRNALAELTTQLAPAPGRIARAFAVSADGLRLPLGLYDTELDEPCRLRTLGDEAAVCLPFALGSVTAFTDAACSTPLASSDTSCTTAHYAARDDDVVCREDVPRLYAYGAQLASDQPIYRQRGSCGSESQVGDSYFELGAEVAPAMLTLHREGSGSVQRVVASDSASQFDTKLHDALHDFDCVIFDLSDGAFHCLSSDNVGVLDANSDAACSRVLHVATRRRADASCAAVPAPKLAVRFSRTDACGASTPDVYEVGEPYDGPIYVGFQGSCTPADTDHEYYQLGRQRSIDELPKAKLVVDH